MVRKRTGRAKKDERESKEGNELVEKYDSTLCMDMR